MRSVPRSSIAFLTAEAMIQDVSRSRCETLLREYSNEQQFAVCLGTSRFAGFIIRPSERVRTALASQHVFSVLRGTSTLKPRATWINILCRLYRHTKMTVVNGAFESTTPSLKSCDSYPTLDAGKSDHVPWTHPLLRTTILVLWTCKEPSMVSVSDLPRHIILSAD
ncbi:hypothetical protein BDB00DRAFT_20978 [Zychaea mexicana]|uniref:uncharacterized protein n=1 Tax=Zychaea mexicana TaxID=64656 RepID=UPI0022FED2AE|nr:uncharacterized protein BDB00DRAFT_20978 [Zychaea mexicana]KAI9497238.1 hypothetical protein BDB00DRAFT_20978 [Zychaea mexicana]